jgi:hypothetical protein
MNSPYGPEDIAKVQAACRSALQDWLERSDWDGDIYLPAFALCLYALRDNLGLDSAMPTGWRLIMPGAGNGAVIGHLTAGTDTEGPEMIGLSEGSRAQVALDQFRTWQNRPEIGQYSVRWLSVPGVTFEGIWLNSLSPGKPDLVAAVFTLDDELKGRVLTGEEFVAIIRPYALWRLEHDDSPAPEGDSPLPGGSGLPGNYR